MVDLMARSPGASGFFDARWPHRYNVSISHSHRFIWFRVAKAGTRSVLSALSGSGRDPIDRQLSDAVVPASVLSDYLSWTFVRDPVERLESCWRDKVCRSNRWDLDDGERTPEGFLDWVGGQDLSRGDRHLRAQHSLVDVDRLDVVGRMESFDRDLAGIFGRIGLPLAVTPRENRTAAGDETPWAPALRERAREIYARDCETFGY